MGASLDGDGKRRAARRGGENAPAVAVPGGATTVGCMRILTAGPLLAIGFGRAVPMDWADQTQYGLDVCANQAFERADRALNDAYKEILRRIGDEHAKQLLVATERAWLAFRDAECKFAVSSTEKGSIYPMEYSLCLEDQTKTRTKELKAYLHCEQGDLSCPVHGE
jgi:uncharacterized protein YecT (DUF1311 family)